MHFYLFIQINRRKERNRRYYVKKKERNTAIAEEKNRLHEGRLLYKLGALTSSPQSGESGFETWSVVEEDFASTEMVVGSTIEEESEDALRIQPDLLKCNVLAQELSLWCIQHNVPQSHTSDLLTILRKWHPELPSDVRTLLKNNGNIGRNNITDIGKGQLWYKGIEVNVREMIKNGLLKFEALNNVLVMDIGIDGLPVFKSSLITLWPIMGCFRIKEHKPFLIAVYYGEEKPCDLGLFLQDYVQEVQCLSINPILYHEFSILVKIGCYICDAPARAFLKCIKPHMAYYSCERCFEKGVYHNGRMVFPGIDSTLRTDNNFKSQDQIEHHTGTSPLETCGTGMITMIPLDYMHMVCQGAMKRLLWFWLELKGCHRLQSRQITAISNDLLKLKKFCPKEFSRRPCSLKHWRRYKATELRTFLLYTGPFVLKGKIEKKIYEHFMLLSIAIYILACPKLASSEKNCKKAEALLKKFVLECANIYGYKMLVYNIHSLIHLSSEVILHGNLDNTSAFKFENFLKTVKSQLRSPYRPLQQLMKRDHENSAIVKPVLPKSGVNLCQQHFQGPTAGLNGMQFQRIITKGMTLSLKRYGDRFFMSKKGIFIVENIIKSATPPHSIFLIARQFTNVTDWFLSPFPSSDLQIFKCFSLKDCLEVIALKDVTAKCFVAPAGNKSYFCIPMMHFQ